MHLQSRLNAQPQANQQDDPQNYHNLYYADQDIDNDDVEHNGHHRANSQQHLESIKFTRNLRLFFDSVRERFGSDSDEFQNFKLLCVQINYGVDYQNLLNKILELIRPHQDLFHHFIEFLPKSFVDQVYPGLREEALQTFLQEIQEEDPSLFAGLQSLMQKHQNKEIDMVTLSHMAEERFRQYPRLYQKLRKYYLEGLLAGNYESSEPIDPKEDANEEMSRPAARGREEGSARETNNNESAMAQSTTQQQSKTNKKNPAKKIRGGAAAMNSIAEEQIQQPAAKSTLPSDTGKKGGRAKKKNEVQCVGGADAIESASVKSSRDNKVAYNSMQIQEPVPNTSTKLNQGKRQPGNSHQPQINYQRTMPDELKSFPKTETNFFLEKLPNILKESFDEFMKVFQLYLMGVLSQHELYDLVRDKFFPQHEDQFKTLQTLIQQRDGSRRANNLLLKPISEFDMSQFRKQDHVTLSYYKLPEDYPHPICSGRYSSELCQTTLNNRYCSITCGSENFKSKIKNQNEENLFKNEDEMYKLDHEILRLAKCIKDLEKEHNMVDQMSTDELRSYIPKHISKNSMQVIMDFYSSTSDIGQKQVLDQLIKQPRNVTQAFLERFRKQLSKQKEQKAEIKQTWIDCCESNFFKSLDHRSFFFKDAHKKNIQNRKQLDEINNISQMGAHFKNINQLKGGTKDCEFYQTYQMYHPTLKVFSLRSTDTPEIRADHPINLREPRLLVQKDKLPQMRFVMNDPTLFDLTIQVLLVAGRVGGATQSDKNRLEKLLELVVEKFFLVKNFKQLRRDSFKIKRISEEDLKLVTKKLYYDKKINNEPVFESAKLQDQPSSSQASHSQSSDEEVKETKPIEKNEPVENKDTSSHEAATIEANQPIVQKEQAAKNNESKPIHSHIVLQSQDEQIIEENTILMPYYKPGYQLLYGDQNFYLWFKQFATIYERLYKAKGLISDKIDDDFKHDEKLKGHEEKKKEMIDELFNQFIAGLIGNLHQSPDQKLDQNKYEDFVRSLMGSNAYLLFVFDKLILATIKLLLKFSNNEESQKSLDLFGTFNKKTQSQTGDVDQLNERSYLAHFQASMQQMQSSSFNGKGVRLLFSPFSKIMTIHMFNLIPYPSTDKKVTVPNQQQQNQSILPSNSETNLQNADNNNKSASSDDNELANKVKDLDRYPPIFLNRNRRKMKEVRKNLYNETIEDQQEVQRAEGEAMIENGLVFRMVPLMNRLNFDADTEDVLLYKRKTALAIEDEFKWSLMAREKFEKITKRRFDQNQDRLNMYTGGMKQDIIENNQSLQKQSSGSSNDGQKSSPQKVNEEGTSPQQNNQMQVDSQNEQSPAEQDQENKNNNSADKQMSNEGNSNAHN